LKGKPLILGGDLNVAHKENDVYDTKGKKKVPGYTPQERASFTELLARGYVDTFRHLYPDRI
jgi:exodeoxyribonuclease-3